MPLWSDLRHNDSEIEKAKILERDATPAKIRAWQYNAVRQPFIYGEYQHSANLLARHRERISGGCLNLFEGRPVMGEAA